MSKPSIVLSFIISSGFDIVPSATGKNGNLAEKDCTRWKGIGHKLHGDYRGQRGDAAGMYPIHICCAAE